MAIFNFIHSVGSFFSHHHAGLDSVSVIAGVIAHTGSQKRTIQKTGAIRMVDHRHSNSFVDLPNKNK
ncbi:MAG: hypothetical protein LBL72_07690 [Candidatus Accumulibacter sp.]|nr:hypothetical protein [Accumulibacter sp.]